MHESTVSISSPSFTFFFLVPLEVERFVLPWVRVVVVCPHLVCNSESHDVASRCTSAVVGGCSQAESGVHGHFRNRTPVSVAAARRLLLCAEDSYSGPGHVPSDSVTANRIPCQKKGSLPKVSHLNPDTVFQLLW